MSEKISRREFLKIAGVGGAASAILTHYGRAARYVHSASNKAIPENTAVRNDPIFATTCGECPAGCGLWVHTAEGRAHKVEGNPFHPISYGYSCNRSRASLQELYHPDRLKGPMRQAQRGSGQFEIMDWDEGITAVKEALQADGESVLWMGLFPDHLADLAQMLASASGRLTTIRYNPLAEFEGRATLADAVQKVFGISRLPTFDLEQSMVTFSFGANFSETWLSPNAYTRMYHRGREKSLGQRGYFVQFEPRRSQTAANADEWWPIRPGSEAVLAQAFARQVTEAQGHRVPIGLETVDLQAAAEASGIPLAALSRLAQIFIDAPRKVALPGGGALGHTNGLVAAQVILLLNQVAGNVGQPGGMGFLPDELVQPTASQRINTLAEVQALVERMRAGKVKALLVHAGNPIYGLPKALGFVEALQKVPVVISFSPYPDETALQSDLILPDMTALESWGYQRAAVGSDRLTVSALQPVVDPVHDTRSTLNILLQAAKAAGGTFTQAAGFTDEIDFIQKMIIGLASQSGTMEALELPSFYTRWLQMGGWWQSQPTLGNPIPSQPYSLKLTVSTPEFVGEASEYPFFFMPYPHLNLSDSSDTNRPWLQGTPDSMTSVMSDSWLEIHPETAHKLGLHNKDGVKVISPVGEIEAFVYECPAIHPQVIAMPLGLGHTALGRPPVESKVNPLDLLVLQENESGALAFLATRVKLLPTGKRAL